ncbi:MAG: nuclear transport factor 2 family protein [Myxococcaceae bacterium]|nr:nuclear transport factor 2 family protein [Myxococcaceae bacterium]MCA3015729.1 nuclear transport factor 2 family protein [Myxococcaceae bacterium]
MPPVARQETTTPSAPASAAPATAQAGWRPDARTREAAPTAPPTDGPEARNRAAAERFFEAFGRGDHAAVEALYRPDVTFKDDMFTLSKRDSVMTMWRSAPRFETFHVEVGEARGSQVSARWVVDYEMFGRKVRNEVTSTLTFDAQGRISAQAESWDRTKWMGQALPFVPRWAQPLAYAVMRPLLSWRMGG